jgi:hypothetical protein
MSTKYKATIPGKAYRCAGSPDPALNTKRINALLGCIAYATVIYPRAKKSLKRKTYLSSMMPWGTELPNTL